ncbi:MAG TPA: hypothetical protein PL110_06685, partial [Candidatus Eremiobacteraeota bacterium]|nr:hypothetical protein [Candidatus Eremiobacteraeota bacterium]
MIKKHVFLLLFLVFFVTLITINSLDARSSPDLLVANNQESQVQIQEDVKQDNSNSGQMDKANEAAGQVVRIRMEQQKPDKYRVWEDVEDSDIIVVTGVYDHLQDVLDATRTPYSLISPGELSRVKLNPRQILMINCPGDVDRKAIEKIKDFVKAGGYLFTTDWCLSNILEKAFPGFVEYNNNPTRDDVVEVQIADKGNPFLMNVFDRNATPCWWLENSSYPIRIVNDRKVNVLITSKEMDRKYGEPSIAITFPYGDGKVIHMTSHFYLQRSDTRYDRQAKSGNYYVKDELKIDMSAPSATKLEKD